MPLALAALLACAVASLGVPAAARFAARFGLLDVPSERSVHRRPVPRTGGAGLFAGWCASVVAAAATGACGWDDAGRYLLPGAAWFAVGWADDLRGLRPGTKLLLQSGCALLAVAVGFRWGGDGIGPFPALRFGAATGAMTWLWFVAVGIVVNFVDGIDLITCATTVVLLGAAAGGAAGPGAGVLYAGAAGAVTGLAFWNASPARVFAGDGGTHLLGFLVASVACGLPALDPPATALPWAVASAPLLPGVIDVAWGIVSKVRRGVPVAAAHSDHLYQRLAKAGTRAAWSHPRVALRYGLLALTAVLVVGRIGPAAGLVPAVLAAVLVLGAHLAHAVSVSRRSAIPLRRARNP